MVTAAAIVVAGGRGTRAGSADGLPKQYRTVAGIPVIRHALSALAGHDGIGRIVPVIHDDDRLLFDQAAASLSDRISAPVAGGATRQQSVFAGLEALAGDPPDIVLIHDAARPFVSRGVIDAVLTALGTTAGAIPALPVSDTLKRGADGRIAATVDRSELWVAQTPQGFRFSSIHAAHRAAIDSGKDDFTDDASIAEWHGLEVALVSGERRNVKLTTREDFDLAEQQTMAEEIRVGQGYDVHAFAPGDQVILCGVSIPHDQSLAGHSDADVALHALTDALLGSIGDGDIGMHFPPSDPQWRGSASDVFLFDALHRVRARGGRLVNVDVTLICEQPKVGPHREAMRQNLSRLLEIDIDRVAVKATTTEGLGFTGRREGIASMATATIAIPRSDGAG